MQQYNLTNYPKDNILKIVNKVKDETNEMLKEKKLL